MQSRQADAQLIEDITQDVFLRLVRDDYRLLRGYDPARASLVTWLTIVARSCALDHLRRKPLPASSLDQDAHDRATYDPPIAEPLALPPGLLSERQRLVLCLLFEKDMTVPEAGAALGVDEQTIRSTKHKALTRLREHLGRP